MSSPNKAGIILPLDGLEEGENTLMLVMPVMLKQLIYEKIFIPLFIVFAFAMDAQSLLPTKYGLKVGVNIMTLIPHPMMVLIKLKLINLYGISGGFYMEIP